MQPTTQSQNLKVCNSCKRTLHVSYFGITRKSTDGYNSCCKECRNYRRRKAYRGSVDHDQTVLPLNENNEAVLRKAIADSLKSTIPALKIETNQHPEFKFTVHDDNALEFDYVNGNERCVFFSRACRDTFVRATTQSLNRQGVRLFSVDHPFSLLEWQTQNPHF